ncbi:MAG: hypothetical protein JW862_10575 [Anaerolineales bacterium]|nr:hypothetical protein [Anaerolineales bacterium]
MFESLKKKTPTWENSLLLLYLAGCTMLLYLAFSQWAYDDPFITYRYASNLRQGLGFVYNAGERVLSTTTPGFALLLAGLSTLWGDIPHLANLVGVASMAAGGLGFWYLGRSWKLPWLSRTGLLLYPTFPLLVNSLGSETPLYLALGIWTFTQYHRRQYSWAVLLAALTTLVRTDGILIPLLLLVDYLVRNRKRLGQPVFWQEQPWLGVGLALVLLLGWHGFAWLYFGAPFPVTLAAKQQQGAMLISTSFSAGFIRQVGWLSQHWHYWLETALVGVGAWFTFRKFPQAWAFLSWPVLYFLAYSALGVSSYPWYYVPLVPGWVLAVGLGLAWFTLSPFWQSTKLRHHWKPWIFGVLLAGLLFGQFVHLRARHQNPDLRYPVYRAAGEWIAENTPEDARVGALEVGILGFYAGRPMIDFAGLIQPAVAEQLTVDATYDDAALWAVETYQPELLVLYAHSFPTLRATYLVESCELTQVFEAEQYHFVGDLEVYTCQP